MLKSKKRTSHDRIFKELYSRQEFAIDLLKAALPEIIKQRLDWQTFNSRLPSELAFISHQFHLKADLIYSCQSVQETSAPEKERELYYFIVEQQSKPDPEMAKRLSKYQMALRDFHDQHKKYKYQHHPIIISLCVYNGTTAFPKKYLDPFHGYQDPKFVKQLVTESMTMILIDLCHTPEQQLAQHGVSALGELLLNQVRRPHFDFFNAFILNWLQRYPEFKENMQILQEMLNYLVDYTEETPQTKLGLEACYQALYESLPEHQRPLMATLADAYRREAYEEAKHKFLKQGIEQGIEQVVLSMLKKGFSDEQIEEATELPEEEFRKLKKKFKDLHH